MTAATQEPTFLSQHHLRIGEDNFYCDYSWDGNEAVPEGFIGTQKERYQVERYIDMASRFNAEVIVELGIRRGGGSALLHALHQPQLLIGIELNSERAADLSAYIAKHDLGSAVKPHYGVDQSDRAQVAAIMASELRGRQIDLVVDDASHLLAQTRASFEVLFPLLREGGVYIVEDWNWEHILADGVDAVLADPAHPMHAEVSQAVATNAAANAAEHDPRLVRMALELVLVRASTHDVIREITVMNNWLVIQRGADFIDRDTFSLASIAKDHFRNLR
jgi:predicted O-methyltransferase YrrM